MRPLWCYVDARQSIQTHQNGYHQLPYILQQKDGFPQTDWCIEQIQDVNYIEGLINIKEIDPWYIVQVVNNNEVDFKKAQQQLMKHKEKLFWTLCAAHCMDLMMKNIGKRSWGQCLGHNQSQSSSTIIAECTPWCRSSHMERSSVQVSLCHKSYRTEVHSTRQTWTEVNAHINRMGWILIFQFVCQKESGEIQRPVFKVLRFYVWEYQSGWATIRKVDMKRRHKEATRYICFSQLRRRSKDSFNNEWKIDQYIQIFDHRWNILEILNSFKI